VGTESDIVKNYAERSVGDLYNSVYSKYAGKEVKDYFIKQCQKFISKISEAKILEIGAGQGNNVATFLEAGFKKENTFANELLQERLVALQSKVLQQNIFSGNAITIDYNLKFNCIYQSTVFTSILNEEDRKHLAEKMWSILEKNGVIFWYDFIYNNPKNKQVKKVTMEEIRLLFPTAKKITFQKITLAPPIGRRVGKFYNWFNWSFLRSHVFAVIEK
jgi:phospholipid N-methyltransferase